MARIHKIQKEGLQAEVGTSRFTMQGTSTLPDVPSLVNTPCWECREAITAGESYYFGAIYQERAGVASGSFLIHAHHVE